jgi:FSR family fosmidomycin resistance protein-like MFS transporter
MASTSVSQTQTLFDKPTPPLQKSTDVNKVNKINLPAILSIVIGHTSVDMQTGSLVVLLPLLLTSFNLNYSLAALIVTVNNLVIAIAQPLFGILGDRKPMRWLIFVGCVLCGTAMISVTLLPNYWLVLIAVVLSGIGSAMFHPEALAATRDVSGDKQATGLSVFFFGGNLGFALGPFLATTLIATFGAQSAPLMIVATLIGTSVLLVQRDNLRSKGVTVVRTQATPGATRNSVIGLVVFLLALIALRSMILSGLQTFIPLYFDRYTNMSAANIGGMLSVLVFSGAFGTLMGGPISERIGRRNTMCAAMVIVLIALFVFLRTDGFVQIIALGIAGAFITMPWPISVVMVQEAMPNSVGLASGLTLGLAYGASGLGISALGALADAIGLPNVMLGISLLPIAVFVMSLFVPERKAQDNVA